MPLPVLQRVQMLLMYDRWNKLAKSFFSEKSGQFDISKVGPAVA